MIKCPECGGQISDKANACPWCGNPMHVIETPLSYGNSTSHNEKVVIVNKGSSGGGCATAGFVMAILGLLFGWIPVFGWIIWLIGVVLCVIGLFGESWGLSLLGILISFIDFFIISALIGGMATFLQAL